MNFVLSACNSRFEKARSILGDRHTSAFLSKCWRWSQQGSNILKSEPKGFVTKANKWGNHRAFFLPICSITREWLILWQQIKSGSRNHRHGSKIISHVLKRRTSIYMKTHTSLRDYQRIIKLVFLKPKCFSFISFKNILPCYRQS